jgi:hypothetical protein
MGIFKKNQIEQCLKELKAGYESEQKTIAKLKNKKINLKNTQLCIRKRN